MKPLIKNYIVRASMKNDLSHYSSCWESDTKTLQYFEYKTKTTRLTLAYFEKINLLLPCHGDIFQYSRKGGKSKMQ